MNYYGAAEMETKSLATGGDSAFVIGYIIGWFWNM